MGFHTVRERVEAGGGVLVAQTEVSGEIVASAAADEAKGDLVFGGDGGERLGAGVAQRRRRRPAGPRHPRGPRRPPGPRPRRPVAASGPPGQRPAPTAMARKASGSGSAHRRVAVSRTMTVPGAATASECRSPAGEAAAGQHPPQGGRGEGTRPRVRPGAAGRRPLHHGREAAVRRAWPRPVIHGPPITPGDRPRGSEQQAWSLPSSAGIVKT